MTSERLKINFGVDPQKIKFEKSENGLYEFSETTKSGFYVIHEFHRGNCYEVVSEKEHSVTKWRVDLSELEKE